jgi:C1A family cysteine protease
MKHQRSYPTKEEFDLRLARFTQTSKSMRTHMMAEHQRGFKLEVDPVELELNKFADWTEEEYKGLLGFRPDTSKSQAAVEELVGDLPASINWVEKGFVTPVKDQGKCGSCWAFSTTGSIESAYWIKNGAEIQLSEQQLVDCTVSYGNNGCGGGLVEYAYHYIENVPLETEAQYPYVGGTTKGC